MLNRKRRWTEILAYVLVLAGVLVAILSYVLPVVLGKLAFIPLWYLAFVVFFAGLFLPGRLKGMGIALAVLMVLWQIGVAPWLPSSSVSGSLRSSNRSLVVAEQNSYSASQSRLDFRIYNDRPEGGGALSLHTIKNGNKQLLVIFGPGSSAHGWGTPDEWWVVNEEMTGQVVLGPFQGTPPTLEYHIKEGQSNPYERDRSEVNLEFYNRTQETLIIYNVTEQKSYYELAPGGGCRLTSYTTTTWEVRDWKGRPIKLTTSSGEVIDSIARPQLGMVFTIDKIDRVKPRSVLVDIHNGRKDNIFLYWVDRDVEKLLGGPILPTDTWEQESLIIPGEWVLKDEDGNVIQKFSPPHSPTRIEIK